jgi:sugar O-acyltransferase (sialic acid O-acetyltransferase NeuD family)
MLIVGARGFAKEVLEALVVENKYKGEVFFYDDVNDEVNGCLYDEFKILKSLMDVNEHLGNSFEFNIGIGNPHLRGMLIKKFEEIGGKLTSIISNQAKIGTFNNAIGKGANIMAGSILTNSIKVGIAPLINLNCTIGHDCIIGDYLEMSPGAHISGYCNLGDYVNVGTNATILPKITIGSNVIVGAGSVVTKDVPDNCLVVGVPAKVVKQLEPLKI